MGSSNICQPPRRWFLWLFCLMSPPPWDTFPSAPQWGFFFSFLDEIRHLMMPSFPLLQKSTQKQKRMSKFRAQSSVIRFPVEVSLRTWRVKPDPSQMSSGFSFLSQGCLKEVKRGRQWEPGWTTGPRETAVRSVSRLPSVKSNRTPRRSCSGGDFQNKGTKWNSVINYWFILRQNNYQSLLFLCFYLVRFFAGELSLIFYCVICLFPSQEYLLDGPIPGVGLSLRKSGFYKLFRIGIQYVLYKKLHLNIHRPVQNICKVNVNRLM